MSETTQQYLFGFWTLIDEILNIVLFPLIGLEVFVLRYPGRDICGCYLFYPSAGTDSCPARTQGRDYVKVTIKKMRKRKEINRMWINSAQISIWMRCGRVNPTDR
jgi:hypothetical protein